MSPSVSTILLDALAVIATAIAPVLATLLVVLLRRLIARIAIDTETKASERRHALARNAIRLAEERAAAAPKSSPSNKLSEAVCLLAEQLPGVDDHNLRRLIETELASVGAGATVPAKGAQ